MGAEWRLGCGCGVAAHMTKKWDNGHKLTEAQRYQIVAAALRGKLHKQIAHEYGVSVSYVSMLLKRPPYAPFDRGSGA